MNYEIFKWMNQYPDLQTERPNWESWFLMLAFITSRRSSCYRHKVGAIIVQNKDVVATGYNGSPAHQPNCFEIGNCYRNDHQIPSNTSLELCRASGSHAESNAIAFASKNGHSVNNATMYIFGHHDICNSCRGIIVNAGITSVIHMKDDGQMAYHKTINWSINPIDMNNKISNQCDTSYSCNNEDQ